MTTSKKSSSGLKRIQWLLNRAVANDGERFDHLTETPPYGDLTRLNSARLILDGVGQPLLRRVVAHALGLLDTSCAIYEKNGDYAMGICTSHWCRFMDCASRDLCQTPDNRQALDSGRWLCHESCWHDAARRAIETGAAVDVPCRGGLHLFALPIVANGDIIGSIAMGYGDPPKSLNKLKPLARSYGVSVAQLQKAAGNYDCRPPFLIDLAKHCLHHSAGLIGKIIERQNADQEAQLIRYTIDHSAEPAFWIGADARLIYVNQAACRSLGYSCQELLGTPIHAIQPEPPKERWPEHWALIKEKGSHTFESFYTTKEGRAFPVEIRVNHVRFEGKEYHCAFVHDLTQRRRRDAERNRLEAQMQEVQKLESLGVLAGGIAHDFNNLLMAILGNADLTMISLPPNASVRRYVEEIAVASKRAAELCRQMLAYSGKGSMMVARHDLTVIVGEMAPMLEASVSKKIVLRYIFDADVPLVMVDGSQMKQIVINLISNASEALADRKGDITISIGAMLCRREYLALCHFNSHLPEGRYVFLEVADTGQGMDTQTRERIFDPFFTTKFVGRGLGLAAVLGIVRSHGGTIRVDSEPGRGTTIRLLLPALPSGDTQRDAAAAKAPESLPNLGILLIDDDSTVREVSSEMLKLLGYTVLTAPNGPKGIALYEKHQKSIGCVILDYTMPELNGLETFDELYRIHKEVRVILSSGYTEKEVFQSAKGREFAGFLQKPYTIEKLRDSLHQALTEAGPR
jgi:PAS domain S-box-containing protein